MLWPEGVLVGPSVKRLYSCTVSQNSDFVFPRLNPPRGRGLVDTRRTLYDHQSIGKGDQHTSHALDTPDAFRQNVIIMTTPDDRQTFLDAWDARMKAEGRAELIIKEQEDGPA